jgi:ketopantoate reductase
VILEQIVIDVRHILCMMNGLGHDERLSQFVPKSQIFLAVTMWTAGLALDHIALNTSLLIVAFKWA